MKNKTTVRLLTIENEIILDNIIIADRYVTRLLGLMGKKQIKDDIGLLIRPCNSIHTFFMKFNIDVIFLDINNMVIAKYSDLAPWKTSKIFKKAKYIIEGKTGCFKNVKIGDTIKIVEKPD